jgi:SAM-dependent methyltransferase
MNNDCKPSSHDRVVTNYFRTTSAIHSVADRAAFEQSLVGLQRRLGGWFDIAGMDVVDLGSGTGQLCALARQNGARRGVGVNISYQENEFACQYVEAEFVLKDICDYLENEPAESVDRIFAMNILEHLDKDNLVRVLDAAYRCLRPGGSLVAMVPNATSPFGGMTRYWDITHHNAFTPSSILQLSRLVGFGEAAEFRECGPVPYAFVSSVRYMLWQSIRLLIKGYLMVEQADTKGRVYTSDMMFRLTKAENGLEIEQRQYVSGRSL